MNSPIPTRLLAEQRAVESQIRAAFRGVTRSNGTTWSEAVVIDNLGSDEERATARMLDNERCWEELVDDPEWIDEPAIGGLNFLDADGYAYYIAPAMIRCARRGSGEFISGALAIDNDWKQGLVSRINLSQARAVARFVRFMIAVDNADGEHIGGEPWAYAYRIYWKRWDAGNPLS